MSIEEVLRNAMEADASDIFLIAGLPLTYKCNGFLNRVSEKMLLPAEIEELVREFNDAGDRNIHYTALKALSSSERLA